MPDLDLRPERLGIVEQAAFQITDLKAALGQQKGPGRTALGSVAIKHIALGLIKPGAFQPQRIQRDIDAAGNGGILIFIGETHVQPLPALLYQSQRLFISQRLQGRLFDQFHEIILGQPHHHAIALHGDRGVALRIGDQRLLAEAVADPEFGNLDIIAPGGGFSGHGAATLGDNIVIIAGIALPDDDRAGLIFNRLQPGKQLLNIGHRHPREKPGLQHMRHPVRVIAHRVDRIDPHIIGPDRRRARARLIGQHQQLIQAVALDDQNLGLGPGLGGKLPGLNPGQGISGPVAAALDNIAALIVGQQFDLALQQEIGIIIFIALLEQKAGFVHIHNPGLIQQARLQVGRQFVYRHQILDLLRQAGFFF